MEVKGESNSWEVEGSGSSAESCGEANPAFCARQADLLGGFKEVGGTFLGRIFEFPRSGLQK